MQSLTESAPSPEILEWWTRRGIERDELGQGHSQRTRQPIENDQSRVGLAAFDRAHVGPVDLRAECKLFLGKAARQPKLAKVSSESRPDVHPGRQSIRRL